MKFLKVHQCHKKAQKLKKVHEFDIFMKFEKVHEFIKVHEFEKI